MQKTVQKKILDPIIDWILLFVLVLFLIGIKYFFPNFISRTYLQLFV
ncbi:MAG: hypothetical protein CLLPBCKN_003234 [Chroococcidiopsis cubana SAG 39.79]|nr:hypothetical protein [Chroococcidiopsis cubana SAG 39.79]